MLITRDNTRISAGRWDPKVAVLIDTRRSEYLMAKSTILAALKFWGLPHHIVDLATTPAVGPAIGRSGAVLIAQEYLGESLSAAVLAVIHKHVTDGAALINADHTLFTYPEEYRALLGITGLVEETSVEGLVLQDSGHAILCNRPAGPGPRLRFPLPALRATGGIAGQVLLGATSGEPLLIASEVGAGRLVQWLLSPKVWNRGYLGFAHGIDSLLWRSILWAAPKPFVMNSLPPYVRFRFDDCNGHWQRPPDLAFVDELIKRGHSPSICFCLKALTSEGIQHLASLQRAGKIDLAPHTYSPGRSLFYGDANGEYSTEQFREMFAELDQAQEEWGVDWSTILSDHDHEWSTRAVPFLRERGIRHKMNILLPGERWTDTHKDWHPGPYGSMSYALDYLPAELSDFFAVFNHHPSFDSARVYVSDGDDIFNYHRPGGFGRQKWDFLNGLVKGSDAAEKDLAGAADRLVEHTQIGLDALFFGGSITHSHFTRFLDPGDMTTILERADARLAGVEQIPASYDEIADYAEAHANTRVTTARDIGGEVSVELAGRSWRELRLSVYTEVDGQLVRDEAPIPAFDGTVIIAVNGARPAGSFRPVPNPHARHNRSSGRRKPPGARVAK